MITEKRTQFLADELEQLRRQGLFRPLRILESAQDTEVIVDGKRVLNLSSNNYLGLTTDPRLKAAMIEATAKWSAGSGAVRTIAGTMTVHEHLARRLGGSKHLEAAPRPRSRGRPADGDPGQGDRRAGRLRGRPPTGSGFPDPSSSAVPFQYLASAWRGGSLYRGDRRPARRAGADRPLVEEHRAVQRGTQ